MHMGIPSIEEARESLKLSEVKVLSVEEILAEIRETGSSWYKSHKADYTALSNCIG